MVTPVTDSDTGTGPGPSAPAPRPRSRRWLVLLLGLVFLFTPAAAYVSGVRATEIENRRLTEFPSLSAGWEFFPQLSAWATDHLPLRDRAVAANTSLSESVSDSAVVDTGAGESSRFMQPLARCPPGIGWLVRKSTRFAAPGRARQAPRRPCRPP